jgi:TonB family protein
MVGNYKENNFFGPFLYYYSNGQVESKGNYSGGDRIGLWEEWYPTGKPREVGNYLPDEPAKPYRYRDTYRISSFWDSTGTQLVTNGTGRFYATDDTGRLEEEGAYASGAKEGKWLDYYENGKVKHEEMYQAGELVQGTYFNEKGESFTYNAYDYEAMPEYPGGMPALSNFLRSQLKYPKEAKKRNIGGTVFVGFVVDNTGQVKDVKVVKGIGFGCDEEAVRVVAAFPPWNPGRQRGQAVSVRYALPIRFLMQ